MEVGTARKKKTCLKVQRLSQQGPTFGIWNLVFGKINLKLFSYKSLDAGGGGKRGSLGFKI